MSREAPLSEPSTTTASESLAGVDAHSARGARSGVRKREESEGSSTSRLGWVVTWVFATVLQVALVHVFVQRPALETLLNLDRLDLIGDEPWLVPATCVATVLALLLPVLAMASALTSLGRVRWARNVYLVSSALVLFWILLDLDMMQSIGRHAAEIARVAWMPEGHAAAGEPLQWVVMNARWLLTSAAVVSGTTWTAAWMTRRPAVRRWGRRTSALLRYVLLASAVLVLVSVAWGPHLMHVAWRNISILERLYGIMPVDLRIGEPEVEDVRFEDPILNELYPKLSAAYEAAFPSLMRAHPVDGRPLAAGESPPHIVMVVTESLRHDVFDAELMPRLTDWAKGGTVATRHDSGTIYSESGMFALLYGRSPAVFHSTLDGGVPPQLCETLRATGYECAYFSGHPKVWMRREEYLNPKTMDRFVHDNRGSWPEWDRRALRNMTEAVKASEQPMFALVFLMSSHFEYQYPPEYEVDLPVARSKWKVTEPTALGREDALPHRNRYRNCMRFIDDAVADAIERLDSKNTLVLFTGDHGESIFDDGRFTHGYAFPEIVTRTAMALVGPSVPERRLEFPTYHVDVVPTLANLVAAEPIEIESTHGLDWYGNQWHESGFIAHSSSNRDVIQVQLRAAGARLRLDLELNRPRVRLLGFEDEQGRLVREHGVTLERAREIGAAFERELRVMGSPGASASGG